MSIYVILIIHHIDDYQYNIKTMRNKLLKIVSLLILGIIIFIVGVYVGNGQLVQPITSSQYVDTNKASVMFDYGNNTMQVFEGIDVVEDTTLFDILSILATQNDIEFTYEDYGENMGVFITSISTIGTEDTPDHWWQYWVNNRYSKVGVSNYVVRPGDVIFFKFMSSQL